MKVKQFMVPRNKLVTCDETTTVEQANGLFQTNRIGSIVVTKKVEETKLKSVGILTKTDILKAYFSGRSGKDMVVSDYMSKHFFTCGEDSDLEDVAKKMAKENIHHVLVLNSSNGIVGLTSSLDIAKQISADAKETFPYLQSLFGISKSQDDSISHTVSEMLAPFNTNDEFVLYHE
jgi:predicted transcriptional regulator